MRHTDVPAAVASNALMRRFDRVLRVVDGADVLSAAGATFSIELQLAWVRLTTAILKPMRYRPVIRVGKQR